MSIAHIVVYLYEYNIYVYHVNILIGTWQRNFFNQGTFIQLVENWQISFKG